MSALLPTSLLLQTNFGQPSLEPVCPLLQPPFASHRCGASLNSILPPNQPTVPHSQPLLPCLHAPHEPASCQRAPNVLMPGASTRVPPLHPVLSPTREGPPVLRPACCIMPRQLCLPLLYSSPLASFRATTQWHGKQNSAVRVRQGSRLCYASRQSSQKWSCARLAGAWYGPKGCSTSLLTGGAAAAAPWAAQAQLFRCASPSNREVLAQQLPGQRTRSGGLVNERQVVCRVPPQVKGGTCTS